MDTILQNNPNAIVSNYKTSKIDKKFCELLCAKFCHDMAGPIGAINNGIDFIESEDQDMKNVAVQLVISSSKQAIDNLTFLRQAYGFISIGTEVSFYNIKTMILNFLKVSKINISIVNESKNDAFNGQTAKLIYNLSILANTIMMGTGNLSITLKGNKYISFNISSSVIKVEKDLESFLTGTTYPDVLTTSNIQVAFVQILIKSLGYEVTTHYSEPKLFVFTLTKSPS